MNAVSEEHEHGLLEVNAGANYDYGSSKEEVPLGKATPRRMINNNNIVINNNTDSL